MSFSPGDLPGNLVLWLSGDDDTFQDAARTTPAGVGEPLGGWGDQGLEGNHAGQATSGKRPVLAQLTNLGHNFRGPFYDGSDDVLVVAPDASLEIDGDFHVYALCRPIDDLGRYGALLMHGVSAAGVNISYECRILIGSGGFRLEFVHGDGATFETLASGSFAPTDAFHILEWKREGSDVTFYCDGLSLGTETQAVTSWTNAGASAHVGNREAGDTPWFGDIAQVLLYDAAHGDSDRARLEAYLTGLGGVTLTSGSGAATLYGVFGPRTRRNRIKRHFFALARRWRTVAYDSFTSSNSDRPGDSDSGHNWVTFSGDGLTRPLRLVNSRMRAAAGVADAAWGGMPMGQADVRVRARATLFAAQGAGLGIAFRLASDGSGWLFHYASDGHWYLSRIAVTVEDEPPAITHWDDLGTSPAWLPGETRLLEVRARGQTVTCHVSEPRSRALPQVGNTQTVAVDGSGETTHGCFVVGAAANEFDNVKVWPKRRG